MVDLDPDLCMKTLWIEERLPNTRNVNANKSDRSSFSRSVHEEEEAALHPASQHLHGPPSQRGPSAGLPNAGGLQTHTGSASTLEAEDKNIISRTIRGTSGSIFGFTPKRLSKKFYDNVLPNPTTPQTVI